MRLKGVGGDLSNLLEEAGVNGCKEIQHRKADHLHTAQVELTGAKKIAYYVPNAEQVAAWIVETKVLAARSLTR